MIGATWIVLAWRRYGRAARGRSRREPPHAPRTPEETMRTRRIIRERPPAEHNGEPAAEFVELAPGELSGVFAAPAWLRDLGMMSWLLVGVAALLVGVAVAAVADQRDRRAGGDRRDHRRGAVAAGRRSCSARGLPRAAGAALVFLAVVAIAVLLAVLLLGGVTSQAAELESALKNGASQAPDDAAGRRASAPTTGPAGERRRERQPQRGVPRARWRASAWASRRSARSPSSSPSPR